MIIIIVIIINVVVIVIIITGNFLVTHALPHCGQLIVRQGKSKGTRIIKVLLNFLNKIWRAEMLTKRISVSVDSCFCYQPRKLRIARN